MAVKVEIPAILQSHTGREKAVEGSGRNLGEHTSDLDVRHGGIAARPVAGAT